MMPLSANSAELDSTAKRKFQTSNLQEQLCKSKLKDTEALMYALLCDQDYYQVFVLQI